MKLNISKLLLACGMGATVIMPSCSLEEENPGGMTIENLAYTTTGFQTLLNNCYFGLQRKFYTDIDFMPFMEGNTDLWTNAANTSGVSTAYFFKFFEGAVNTTFTDGLWNSAYDGIGACNLTIANIGKTNFSTTAERKAKEAEARFLRAVYYYNLVEIFGGVVMITNPNDGINYAPERTDPLTIYREIIIPDLEYAVENLNVGDDTYLAVPTKKSALGFLTKACLATQQYDTTEFLERGYEAAKILIADCEAGGAQYGAYMYPTYDEVFAEKNNLANKEALWKYNLWADAQNYGSSNGNYRLNRNNQHFTCNITRFGARLDTQEARMTWEWNTNEGGTGGDFMPTQHLLSLFVEEDGSLDPRFHKNFLTEWSANNEYEWNTGDMANYGKASSMEGTPIHVGDKAIKFVMPQDADYASEIAAKSTSPYLLIDYKDVYDDANRSIVMTSGSGENMYRYFYPSLTKHNSTNYHVANASKKRNGNLNAVLIMRMAEIYLIAAEYDIILNGGSQAMTYINKVRQRAGAKTLSGAATIRTVLDERGRELCGEFTRFFDLKRTGMFKDASYLTETHPDLAQYFKPEFALRPISSKYTDLIANGAVFTNPGY